MRSDLRLALRTFARNPGFALAATLTLALGVGANTAIFSIVDSVLLRPAPVDALERIVVIWETTEHREPRTSHAPATEHRAPRTFPWYGSIASVWLN